MKKSFLYLFAFFLLPLAAFESGSWQKSNDIGKLETVSGVCRVTLPDVSAKPSDSKLEINDGISDIKYPKAQLVFSREFTVKPETVYLLKLSVKSANAVTMRAAGRIMAYTLPEKKQQLCDLIKSDKSGKLTVRIELGGLPGKSDYELSGFELREPKLDSAVPIRPVYGKTVLDKNSVIIAPAALAAEAKLVQQAVKAKCGLLLAIVSDVDATQKDVPVLLDKYKAQHLILLGNINNNRAIWAAYNKFLAAADGYYPGKGGYVVRTAADVFGNKRNHIILGGSDVDGVKKAVNVFNSKLKSAELPFLLDVKLGGECLAAFNADEKLWNTRPAAAGPRLLEPGYGKVVRWYVNVMGYYWSGRESYKKRSQLYLKDILKDNAYTHHYILEFFVRAYDMVDHAGVFTPAERSKIDALLKKNFMEFICGQGSDLTWMKNFSRPYELLVLLNRHNIAPFMSDLTNGDFLAQNVPLNADEKAIVQYRREEKHEFMKYWSANSFCASLPRTITEVEDEMPAALFRYSLSNEHYAAFTSGNARNVLHLWDLSPRHPSFMDDRFLAGILAVYYKEPGFVWLYRNMPTVKNHFQMRYVCNVHRYAPDPGAAAAEPLAEAGVRRTVFQKQDHILWRRLNFRSHQTPAFPAKDGSEKITFRSGFKLTDDFMKISTLGSDVGGIIEFSCYGVNLLRTLSSAVGLADANYYECNAVNIQQLDKLSGGSKPYAGAAKIDSLVNSIEKGSVSFTIDPYADCIYQRSIAKLSGGRYVVRDRITAAADGEYLIQIGWHPQGAPLFNGKVWRSINGKVNFYLTPIGEKFKVVDNLENFRKHLEKFPDFHHTAHVKLAKGESVTAYTLLEVFPTPASKPSSFEHGKDDMLRINGELFQFTTDGKLNKIDSKTAFAALPSALPADAAGSDFGTAAYEAVEKINAVQQPGNIRFVNRIINGKRMIDFGKVYNISEIRAANKLRFWAPRTLPDDLEYSVDGKVFHKITSEKIWRSAVKTANYGQADPQKQGFQCTFPNVKARFFTSKATAGLLFFSSDVPLSRSDLEIVPSGKGFAVQSSIFPRFLRDRVANDYLYANFDSELKLRYTWRAPACVQDNKVISFKGRDLLCAVTDDAMIYLVNETGKVEKVIDLYKLQGDFHRRYQKGSSRQPLGGFTMPFSIGIWQESANSEPLLTVGRYGWVSFVTLSGQLKGVLYTGDYVLGRALDKGMKLPDGKEAFFALGWYNLIRISGPENSRRQGICPIIYQSRNFRLPATGTAVTEGDDVLFFQPVSQNVLAVCRSSFLAFFDNAANRWISSWKAPVALSAAGMVGQQEYLTASNDFILRSLTFDAGYQKITAVKTVNVGKSVRHIRNYGGKVLVVNGDGVFEYADGKLQLLFAGDCRDAAIAADGRMLVLMNNGELIICKKKN